MSTKPKFGVTRFLAPFASEDNPHRIGTYVRTVRRTGILNPGVHYELTDGNGDFWQHLASGLERVEQEAIAARAKRIAEAEQELVEHVMAVLECNPQFLSHGTRLCAEKLKEARNG